jgi:hypothetical protein
MILLAGALAMNLLKSAELCGYSYLVAVGDSSSSVVKKESAYYYHYLDNHQIIRTVLPKRMITVFGLERSGTSLVFHTLGKALNLTRVKGEEEYTNHPDNTIRIQHMSLPLGEFSEHHKDYLKRFEPLHVLPVKALSRCMPKTKDASSSSSSSSSTISANCKIFANVVPPPAPRYFVNITSHLQWYQRRGVQVQAVVVVRDPTLHFQSISQKCENETAAYAQYEQGVALMQHAMQHVNPITVVSYETLTTLRGQYMNEIYESLGIQSDYMPPIRNGNAKYVQSIPQSVADKLIDEKR